MPDSSDPIVAGIVRKLYGADGQTERYEPLGDFVVASYHDGANVTAYHCGECGCLVADTETHDRWHDWVGR